MIRAALVLLALTLATFGDVLGNIREQKLGTRTIAVNYTASTNRVLTAIDGGTTRNYTWDTRGPFETPPSAAPQDVDATGVAGQTFTYDLANQPTAVTGVATYAYDGNMKRVKEVRGGKTIYTIYSRVTGGLIYRDEATDAIKTDYVNVGGAALRLKKAGTGAPVAEYTHFDSQGSAVAGTNAAGTVAWRERYAPFGEELLNAAANNNNTGYTGHLKDDATGLTYMQARLQDPYSGRFLSTDPIGHQDQLNLYAYVANDPVNMSDPNGEQGAPDFIQDQRNAAAASFAKDNPVVSLVAGAAVVLAAGVELGAIAIANPVAATEIATAIGEITMGDAAGAGLGGALAARATDIHSALDPIAQSMRTTAVVETAQGGKFVASSENSLSKAQQSALQPGEMAAKGPGHAEMTAVRAAEAAGQTPVGVGASREICEDCMSQLRERGIED